RWSSGFHRRVVELGDTTAQGTRRIPFRPDGGMSKSRRLVRRSGDRSTEREDTTMTHTITNPAAAFTPTADPAAQRRGVNITL
ncbi:MAG: hypothetical protein ACRDS0_13875, partial [Pseudonocardiaceae bacterium]